MAAIDTAMASIHLLFAGIWAGAVVFVAVGVLPAADDLGEGGLAHIAGRARLVSRASALLLLITGGYMAGSRYTASTLLGSVEGTLVVGMVVLWVVLAGFVEIGSARLTDGRIDAAGGFYAAASAVAAVLLLLGGVLVA